MPLAELTVLREKFQNRGTQEHEERRSDVLDVMIYARDVDTSQSPKVPQKPKIASGLPLIHKKEAGASARPLLIDASDSPHYGYGDY